jgi:replicative DNA helicase
MQLENEKHLLGCFLMSQTGFDNTELKATDFDDLRHNLIYSAMVKLSDAGEPIDVMTVNNELRKTGETLTEYLSELMGMIGSGSTYEFYAKRVKEESKIRQLINITQMTSQMAKDGSNQADSLIRSMEEKLAGLQSTERGSGTIDTTVAVNDVLADVIRLKNNPQDTTGLTTGWGSLDRKTSGLHESDLIILAARPAKGKSSFALQLARNVAIEARTPVFFFSLEMGAEQLIQRLVSCESKVELNKLRNGRVSDTELQALELGSEIIKSAPLFFNDRAGIQLKDIRSALKLHNARHEAKIGFVVVDYLQLMATGVNTSNMVTQVTEISRGLKMIAKDFNIPVLALSQLSRNVESRGGKPRLSDLRDSGSIEQDADIVCFLHSDSDEQDSYGGKEVELIIAKHRNGACGELSFNFNASKMNFLEVNNINKW